MATVQDRKAPSAGTKVSAGPDAAVTREGAGPVAPESLAAESYREDGGFATNRSAQPDQSSSQTGSNSSNYTTSAGSAAQQQGPHGGAAPSYVAAQLQSDPNGPHGKNLTEGGFDDARLKDGLKLALNSEPGSANDPSRLAEAQFKQDEAAQPGATAHRQADLNTNTVYDALDRETSS